MVTVLKAALICNGYSLTLDDNYDSSTESKVTEFQKFMCLDSDSLVIIGSVNRRTWSALLQSKGDPERDAIACDCASILTQEKAAIVKENGYKYVGRYLTGTVIQNNVRVSKALTIEEIFTISNNGLRIFSIYQDGGASSTYFNYDKGYSDAAKAFAAAKALKIPFSEIIYFAVDYDFTSIECREKIIPYFSGITKYMNESGNRYRVGIYASRNICTMVMDLSYAESCFVADMSTGYSGNLGYPMPQNWAFEQFHEYGILGSQFQLALDKDMASGRYKGFVYNDKCGGDNYKDIDQHDMILNNDGYYECTQCGYKVPSPFIQDDAILDEIDAITMKALNFAYGITITSEDFIRYFYSYFTYMHDIRKQSKYNGKYSYCNKNGDCLFIKPGAVNTETEIPISRVLSPSIVSATNISRYNGVYSSLVDSGVNIAFGLYLPTTIGEDIAQAILNYIQSGNTLDSITSVLESLANLADPGWRIIVTTMKLGATVNEIEQVSEVRIGDIVVEIVFGNEATPKTLSVIFNSKYEFKNLLFN